MNWAHSEDLPTWPDPSSSTLQILANLILLCVSASLGYLIKLMEWMGLGSKRNWQLLHKNISAEIPEQQEQDFNFRYEVTALYSSSFSSSQLQSCMQCYTHTEEVPPDDVDGVALLGLLVRPHAAAGPHTGPAPARLPPARVHRPSETLYTPLHRKYCTF